MRLRLVPRLERSRPGTLRPPHWWLPRWAARGPEQRKPGGGIDAGLSPLTGGNAADAKHRDGRSTSRYGGLHRPMRQIDVRRSTVTLDPDPTHVLARPFRFMSDQRSVKITARVMALAEDEVHTLLGGVRAEFADRQVKIDEFLLRRFNEVRPYVLDGQRLSEERKLLLGGYFTHEYSLEAAALFNPSMVPHPDQSDVPPGSLRFILSLRATAEGHVSSIAFRSGILDANSNITMDFPSRYSLEPMQVPNSTFEKQLFERKLQELRLMGDFNRAGLSSGGGIVSQIGPVPPNLDPSLYASFQLGHSTTPLTNILLNQTTALTNDYRQIEECVC